MRKIIDLKSNIDPKKLKVALKNSMKRTPIIFLAILLSGVNLAAQADHEPGYQAHDGFFLSMSIGPGMVNINDDITGGTYSNLKMSGIGAVIDIKLGAAVSENLILHGDIISISSGKLNVEADGSDIGTIEGDNSLGNIMLGGGITYYFMPSNVFVSGSGGIARFTITTNDQTSSTQAGLGLHVKAGKEWWISSRWGLGVSAIVNYAHVNNEADNMTEVLNGTFFGLSFNATFN